MAIAAAAELRVEVLRGNHPILAPRTFQASWSLMVVLTSLVYPEQ